MKTGELTAFSWGYWGWGTTVPHFLEAAAAAEAARGFAPPAFADVRIRRSVRAPGFRDAALERTVGPGRYRWFNGLGNLAVVSREPGVVRIADPGQSDDLLDYIEQQAESRRRVIFFCACEVPEVDGTVTCHRREVADLLLASARRRKVSFTVVEWPGGEPEDRELTLPSRAARGGQSVPLGTELPKGGLATLPWFSLVRVHVGSEHDAILSGPAAFQRGQWRLPILSVSEREDDAGWGALRDEASASRVRLGLNPRTSR